MERVYKPTLAAQILLTLVQQITMYEHQCSRLYFFQFIFLIDCTDPVRLFLGLQPCWPSRALHLHKLRSQPSCLPHEPLTYGRPLVTALRKAQTPIVHRRILQRDPKPHRTRRIGVQKRAVLMRLHPPSDLRLLANDHGLQNPRIPEPQLLHDPDVQRGERGVPKGKGEHVQVMADLVDGPFFGFRQRALLAWSSGCGEGVFFEEKPDLVPGV